MGGGEPGRHVVSARTDAGTQRPSFRRGWWAGFEGRSGPVDALHQNAQPPEKSIPRFGFTPKYSLSSVPRSTVPEGSTREPSDERQRHPPSQGASRRLRFAPSPPFTGKAFTGKPRGRC